MQTTVHAISLALEHCADAVKENAGVIDLAGEFDTLMANLGNYLTYHVSTSCTDDYYRNHLADDIAEGLANVEVMDVWQDSIKVMDYTKVFYENTMYCTGVILRFGDDYNFSEAMSNAQSMQERIECIVNTVIWHNYVTMLECINNTY